MSQPTPEMITALQAADHDDKRTVYIAGNCVCLFVAFVSVALRFWSRRLARTNFGPDDWLVFLSVVSEINSTRFSLNSTEALQFLTSIYTALLIACVHFGMGRHAWWIVNGKGFAQVRKESFYVNKSIDRSCSLHLPLRRCTTYRCL
jgi:hypothetical protein